MADFFHGAPGFPTRFGTDSADTPVVGTGAPDDLWLQLFGGEVLTHYYESTVMRGLHYRRGIKGGKSARFPRLYKLDAEYHQPGLELLGQTTRQTEIEITLDAILTSHFSIYDLDAAISHFDVRSVYTEAAGQALAQAYDKNVMRQVILAARAAAPVAAEPNVFPAGLQITDAIIAADGTALDAAASLAGAGMARASALISAARSARMHYRRHRVPDNMPVYGVISPEDFDLLKYFRLHDGAAYVGDMIFQKLDHAVGGVGLAGIAGLTESITLEGIQFFPSQLIPDADDSADTSVWPKYRGDFSTTIGLVWAPMAVGTLELLGMSMEMVRDGRRMENFVNASMAVGHGMLRQELNVEITNQ